MKFREREIPLALIDPTDHTFRITTNENFDDLTDSIRRIGLLNLPILIEAKAGFSVVSGFRRIAACQYLKKQAIRTRLVPTQATTQECSLVAIGSNALERPLNLIEQSRALCLLSKYFTDEDQLRQNASALGLTSNPEMIKKLMSIDQLAPAIACEILSGTLTLTMALELGQLDRNTGESFAALFSELKLSLNKQREILTLVAEIAKREDVSMQAILSEDTVHGTLLSRDLDRTQKTHTIRSYLRRRRFPTLATSEAHYASHRQKLELGSQIKLQPPRNFEGRSYTLTMSIADMRDFEHLMDTLDKLQRNPSMQILLNKDF